MKDRPKNLSFFIKEPSATFLIKGISNEHMNRTEKFGQKIARFIQAIKYDVEFFIQLEETTSNVRFH